MAGAGGGCAPDDAARTGQGLAPAGRGPVLLVACGALAREILALRDAGGWTHLDLACLPAILHNTPDRIPDAVRDAIRRHRADYATILVAYADCGTGGRLAAVCAEERVEMLRGPHCYAFFDGVDAFAARAATEFTAFYLTDFLARQFDAFVTRPLGLDRHPHLRDAYFGNYDRLVYLAQTDDPALTALAEAAARRLGLAFERRFTGYGDLAPALAGAALAGGRPQSYLDGPKEPRPMDLALPPRVTPRAFARLAEINDGEASARALRVAVEGGGCSGFQYDISLDDPAEDDLVIEAEGQRVLVDPVSLPFLRDAVIDFSDELIGARFVVENPNATSSCGCGVSFSI